MILDVLNWLPLDDQEEALSVVIYKKMHNDASSFLSNWLFNIDHFIYNDFVKCI